MTAENNEKEVRQLLYKSMLWRGLFFASSFFLQILFARIYQASASGLVLYMFAYYTLFVQVLGFSLESGLGFYAAKTQMPASMLITVSVVLTILVGAAAAIFFHLYIPESINSISRTFINVTALAYICGNVLIAYMSSIFYGYRNFYVPNIAGAGINLLLIILLLIAGQTSGQLQIHEDIFIQFYFYSFLLHGIVMLIAALVYYYKKPKTALPYSAEFKKIWAYSLRAFISNLIFFILYRVDYWFVEEYCSAEELGNYIQASKLAQLFFTLPTIIASAVFPLTAGGDQGEINKNLKGIALTLLFVNSLACVFLSITGYWLFPFVYGSTFHHIYLAFLLLIPGILALSMLYPFTAYYAGKNRIDVNTKGSLLALVVVIVGDIIFIPRFGINGAALISSAGYIAFHLSIIFFYKKEQQLTTTDLFAIKSEDISWVKRFIVPKFFKTVDHEQ